MSNSEKVSAPVAGGGGAGTPSSRWAANGGPDPHGNRYDCERAALAGGDMTDDEVANAVFLAPNIANLTIAKDRVRWLSRRLAEERAAVAELIAADKEYDEALYLANKGYGDDNEDRAAQQRLREAIAQRRAALSNIEGGKA